MASIRQRGTKWQVQVRRLGHRSITKSFHNLKDAQSWARQTEVQADRAELPSNPNILKQVTLGQLVIRYRDTVSINKKTYSNERVVLDAFLRRSICFRSLSELRTSDFVTYRDDRLRVLKASSLRRELTPIKHLFEVARREWGLPIRENPLAQLSVTDADQRRERRLRPGEFEALQEAARKSRNKLIAPLFRFALITGMRRGEILAMKWSHVDHVSRALLIPTSKNGKARTIPLSEAALQILNNLPGTNERIFPLTANGVRLAWERLRRRAAIRDLHFHDLRHEAISRFFEAGLSLPEVALISGHKDARMLLRYTHPLRQLIHDKLDRLSEYGESDQWAPIESELPT